MQTHHNPYNIGLRLAFFAGAMMLVGTSYLFRNPLLTGRQSNDPDRHLYPLFARRRHLYQRGTRIFNREQAGAAGPKSTLKSLYEALWCIGRSGFQVHENEKAEAMETLMTLHMNARPKADRPIVHWYAGDTRDEVHLSELLANCPEVRALGLDPRFIAAAFGYERRDLTMEAPYDDVPEEFFDGLTTEVS